jgi:hypothetical protein
MLSGVTTNGYFFVDFGASHNKKPQLKPGVNSSLKETGMKRCYPNLPDVEAIKKAA